MRFSSTLLLTSYCLLLPFLLSAQQSANNASLNLQDRPTTQAFAIEIEPLIDGEILQDAVWQQVKPFGDLIQTQPYAGQPASEKTEIRIAYTPTTLYLSVICYDAQPEALVVSDARRDASLDNTDAFLFILDTYHDGQNGFVFGTNSLGVEYDAQVDNEGQGNLNANRQQGGMIGGFNLNWDASWEVKTQVGDYGWSAEFAIPFRTIRFKSGDDITWGANFRRNIRKSNEVAYWAPLPIQFTLNRLSLAGDLKGLNLVNPGNLKVIPYALGQVYQDIGAGQTEPTFRGDFGGDIKYSITPSVTLDLTYNTDFAQVEVDEQQINLDRFNLFFPEKRPFFLENAGLFSVGSPGEVDLFFSRRIGIGEEGDIVPIIGGARLSGRINQTNFGALSMFTEGVNDAGIEANNFSIARINHQFAQRSYIGGAFINREGMGDAGQDYNRTFAADGKWGIGNKAQISGFYAQTATPGIEDDQHAFQIKSNYEWGGLVLTGAYTEVGEGFNPEVGFLQRTAFRKPEFLILKRIRPKDKLGLLELRPHVSYRSFWNFDNFLVTSFLHVDNHWEWKNGMELHTGINFTTEGVVSDFEISEGVIVPAGSYSHQEAQLVFFTNQSKAFSVYLRSVMGGFFGGKRQSHLATLRIRAGDRFSSEFTLIYNDVSLENGDFTTTLFRSRLSYSFTPRIFTQSLVQYNSVANLWSANIRLGWLQRANTGLFLVYNDVRGGSTLNNRTFTVKYPHMLDVLR